MATDELTASGLEDRERLLGLVATLAPTIEQGATEAEEQRTLPRPLVEQLKREHLFWLKTPHELGGSPVEPLVFCDLIEALAYHDASAAWTVMIGNGSAGLIAGWLPEAGIEAVFPAGGPLPMLAGQPQPRGGVGRAVDGGIVVSGRWAFASGIHHADWIIGACPIGENDLGIEAKPVIFVVPRAEATIYDSWFAAGLQGTGSADFSLEEVFVPLERMYEHPLTSGPVPGLRGGALFRQPWRLFVANELPPLCVGVARRAIADIAESASTTLRGLSGMRQSERGAFRKELALAEARVRAADLLYRDALGAAWSCVVEERPLSERQLLATFVAQSFVAESCLQAVLELFRYGGGRFLALSHPAQRHVRNLLAARQHSAATEEMYELGGSARLSSGEPLFRSEVDPATS